MKQLDIGDSAAWIGRVDFAYPSARLVIELDSDRHHSSKLDRDADNLRDARLTRAGWRIVRIRWDDVVGGPDQVVTRIRSLLADSAA